MDHDPTHPALRDRLTLAVDAISLALKHLLVIVLENVASTAATMSTAAHSRVTAVEARMTFVEHTQQRMLTAMTDLEEHLAHQDAARQAIAADVQTLLQRHQEREAGS